MILNIFLDPLFIFTLGLGVKGAALATVLSQAVAASVFVYLLFFKEHAYVTFDLKDFRPSGAILGEIFNVGAPASFSFIVMAVGGMVFNRILIGFSEETVAAYQVGARIDHIFMLPVIALSAGLVTLVGMYHGAKRKDLVRGSSVMRCVARSGSLSSRERSSLPRRPSWWVPSLRARRSAPSAADTFG